MDPLVVLAYGAEQAPPLIGLEWNGISVGGVNRDVVMGSVYLPYDAQETPPSKELPVTTMHVLGISQVES